MTTTNPNAPPPFSPYRLRAAGAIDVQEVRSTVAAPQASAPARSSPTTYLRDPHTMTTVKTLRDAGATALRGIEDALYHRLAPASMLSENGRRYAGLTLIELGRDLLGVHGISTRGMDRFALSGALLQYRGAGMNSSGDFPSLMANVSNKRLRAAYEENPGTFKLWARRAQDAVDFKTITTVQISAMPDLLQVNEHGEFKYGTVKDGAESYSLLTSGRIVSISRQAIINDDLRAFDRLLTGFAGSAARLENRAAYAQLTGNPVMGDGVQLFHATHANVGTGGGSALQLSALATARAAMRVQKGLQGEELNLAPSFLIGPAALEQTMYQLTSASYVPATTADISEFRSGGRTSLTPVVEPILDGVSASAWFLATKHGLADTVEYCYLEGADVPQIEVKSGFSTDGISMRCRHDFAAKVVDWRGLYRAAGA